MQFPSEILIPKFEIDLANYLIFLDLSPTPSSTIGKNKISVANCIRLV